MSDLWHVRTPPKIANTHITPTYYTLSLYLYSYFKYLLSLILLSLYIYLSIREGAYRGKGEGEGGKARELNQKIYVAKFLVPIACNLVTVALKFSDK
jgi:hypothetical protein